MVLFQKRRNKSQPETQDINVENLSNKEKKNHRRQPAKLHYIRSVTNIVGLALWTELIFQILLHLNTRAVKYSYLLDISTSERY
jgi:hypothetical protein